MKITNVQPTDDYRLLIDFEKGNQVIFNMQYMVETLPYLRLKNLEAFKSVLFEDKAVYWDPPDEKLEIFPIRITVDSILFTLR